MLLSNLTIPNITAIGQDATAVFSPYLQDVHAFSTVAHSLRERWDDSCTQTVEVPVWYGLDYDICSMQSMTAPCSVSFPAASCHTHLPPSQPLIKDGLSGTTQLWIVIGVSVFFVILVPVTVLWIRWKLINPRRGGKRSISVQLEKNEGTKTRSKESSKSGSGSKSTSIVSAGQPSTPSGGGRIVDRLLGTRITNNININTGQPNHSHFPENRHQQPEELQPMSPRIALESLRPGHPLGQAENQPWMHQDHNGRWVPREEGYLHPGLPPPPRVRPRGDNERFMNQVDEARRAGQHVPGEWRY